MTTAVSVLDQTIRISVFNNAFDNVAQERELTIAQFIRLLSSEPELVEVPADTSAKGIDAIKEQGEMWSPCSFNSKTRSKDVKSFSCLPLDLDLGSDGEKGLTPEDEDALFGWLDDKGYLYVAHTSFMSGYFAPRKRFRVVLFLNRPIPTIEEYKKFWSSFVSRLPVGPDTSRRDNGCFFSPRCPSIHASLHDSFWHGTDLLPVTVSGGGSVGLDYANARMHGRRTAADWERALRTTAKHAWALVRDASFALAAQAAHPDKDQAKTLAEVWTMCRAALEANPVKTVKWDSKYKVCSDGVRDGWAKGLAELAENKSVTENFSPTEAQVNRAQTTLNKQRKLVETDAKQLGKAAYLMGRYTPHVLSGEHVRNVLFKAATQLADTRKDGINGSQADLEIAAGIAKGQKNPHFIYAGWKARLTIDKEKGTIIASDGNAGLFFQHHPDVEGMLRFNVRKGKAFFQYAPPWPFRETTEFPCALRDDDGLEAENWLASQMGKPLGTFERTVKVMAAVARRNEYDPFRDWLEEQRWDGTPRLDSWLHNTCNIEDSPYHKLVGSKFVLSIVARTLEPGCDAQHVLVLTGPQGIGKSQAFRALASAEYFCSNAGELGSDDFLFNLEKYVIVELAELAGFSKKAIEEIKRLVSGTQEDLRRKYAASSESTTRRAVFGGTTNQAFFLQDETGNRRFWPVQCAAKINIAWLGANRSQLWAEALHRYNAGEKWWPETETEKELCEEAQREHLEVDELDEKLDLLTHTFSMSLFEGCTPTSAQIDSETGKLKWATLPQVYSVLGLKMQDVRDQRRVGKLLTIRGWTKTSARIDGKKCKIVAGWNRGTGGIALSL